MAILTIILPSENSERPLEGRGIQIPGPDLPQGCGRYRPPSPPLNARPRLNPAEGRGGEAGPRLKRLTLSKQSPLTPKVPAEQRDKKLPQLPPLFHEAWLRVTPPTVLGARLTSTAPFPPSCWRPLTGRILDACLFLVQLPGPPQASTGVWGLPAAAP